MFLFRLLSKGKGLKRMCPLEPEIISFVEIQKTTLEILFMMNFGG